ncbi:dihydrolipoamide dehydrogenase [Candidatus Peregrinibacteria bacterium CG_4_9_14_0_2_um_filter_53_11]|nr:MAG: dihydrolipoamide dehydrogenase [Candidatus Peregrinibacteria bacterium CG_4_9_14_0_2_um_filter_53_11]
MKKYDVIIIGGGGGLKLRPVTKLGKKLAIIERESLGGTCLNRGCIPSKMLIHPADVADEIRHAGRFNLSVSAEPKVDFEALVTRVTDSIKAESEGIKTAYAKDPMIDFYPHEARFVEDKVIEVNGEQLTADYIFIAVGARPLIPPIEGLEGTPYMTSTEAIYGRRQPKKLIVIGGGYIAAELGHFFGGLGTEVHLLVRGGLLAREDSEVVEEFSRVFKEKYHVHEGINPIKVAYENGLFSVTVEDHGSRQVEMGGDALLVATGVRPNTDTLGLENTSIKLNQRGFIEVDDHLRTAAPGVYALGDCVGNFLFRHSVNFEGEYLLRTLFTSPGDEPINYSPMPHAVFSSPQVAGVGKTEDELKAEGKVAGVDYIVGLSNYKNSAMGDALRSDHGFCKVLFERSTRKLIGAHIVGAEASNMIHMLVAFMTMNATLDDLLRMIYIHPALPEIVRNAARKAQAAFEKTAV